MGRSSLAGSVLGSTGLLQACQTGGAGVFPSSQWPRLKATSTDQLELSPGLSARILIRWQDPINPRGDLFGYNNDFLAFLPGKNKDEGFLWVNHEYVHPLIVSGYDRASGKPKTKSQIETERKNVGGSFVRISRNENESWTIDTQDPKNFRIDGTTPMSLVSERPIQGQMTAIGTTGNCCGGQTPWGTILTCEENTDDVFGDVNFSRIGNDWKRTFIPSKKAMAWNLGLPPEHYGWVVEINPQTKSCKKLTALGRFAHEGALVVETKDGRVAVYMGDDANNQHFYKFISSHPGSLSSGKLYVAKLETGTWELLSLENPKLKGHFADQTDLLIRTREAAKILGATPLDRPEACAQDPYSKGIFLSCTMNRKANRPYGSILKFMEKNNDPLSLEFTSETFLHGGPQTDFACPDNICFDPRGNLWFTSDIADDDLNQGSFSTFGNNGLFFVPMSGPFAGQAHRFASAPMEAEFTGPCFSPDGKTLFLSVQHPGASTENREHPTSHWPEGGQALPRPAVIAIEGPLLNRILKRKND